MNIKPLRRAIGRMCISLRHHKWTAWVGRLSLCWNRFLNPDLRVGKRVRVRGRFSVCMHGDSEIVLGEKARIVSDAKRSELGLHSRCKFVTYPGARIVIGNRVLLSGTVIVSRRSIEIGEATMLAPNVMIIDSNFHSAWPPEKRFDLSPIEEAEPVRIGKRVWIGLNATILKGTTIGDNSIIGAGSVVTGSIPPNVLAAGVPARVIRRLDEPDERGADA